MMKNLVLEVTSKLPNNATIEEILDAIMLRISVEKGLQDIKDGNTISSKDLLKEIEAW